MRFRGRRRRGGFRGRRRRFRAARVGPKRIGFRF